MGFGFEIEYKPEKENVAADNMLRRNEEDIVEAEDGSFMSLSSLINEITSILKEELKD